MKLVGRLHFIDQYRGLAVLWMIETHISHICLSTASKVGWFWNFLYMSNGFVAQAFLFCAGASLTLQLQHKGDTLQSFSPDLAKYLKRLGIVLLAGYWLNLPTLSFEQIRSSMPEVWEQLLACDILHAIVFSSLISFVLFLGMKRLSRLIPLLMILTVTVFFVTPWLWQQDLHSLPVVLRTLVSPDSKFPLVPWSGYFFSGTILTFFLTTTQNPHKLAEKILVGAVALALIAFWVRLLPFTYVGDEGWGRTSPGHHLFRLGIVVVIFTLFYFMETKEWLKNSAGNILQNIGQESLFVYVFHNMLIYGSVVTGGLRLYVNERLNFPSAFLLLVLVSAFCYGSAMTWHYVKKDYPLQARWALLSAWGVFLFIFFSL